MLLQRYVGGGGRGLCSICSIISCMFVWPCDSMSTATTNMPFLHVETKKLWTDWIDWSCNVKQIKRKPTLIKMSTNNGAKIIIIRTQIIGYRIFHNKNFGSCIKSAHKKSSHLCRFYTLINDFLCDFYYGKFLISNPDSNHSSLIREFFKMILNILMLHNFLAERKMDKSIQFPRNMQNKPKTEINQNEWTSKCMCTVQ